ncbi:hypothetical protein VTK56DRAFT_354 [Thermocarpiscus australiensis]
MGLVDYSDSESESEAVQQKPAAPATTLAAPKKPFQKLLDRSGKIVVNLPAASASPSTDASADVDDEQPPAKRAKTSGGSRFSNLGSFLPPPKKTAPAATGSARKPGTAPAPGVHLKTAAEPAFIRGADSDFNEDGDGDSTSDAAASTPSGMNLPPPNSTSTAGPSIPEGQKPEEEVKLVGKPLMFKPLSVARKKAPAKNKKKDQPPVTAGSGPDIAGPQSGPAATAAAAATSTEPPKKKVSLFSMSDDTDGSSGPSNNTAAPIDTYEPIFTTPDQPTDFAQQQQEDDVTSAYPTYHQPPPATHHHHQQHQQQQQQQQQTLTSLADGLSPAARRELFGRADAKGRPNQADNETTPLLPANAKVVTFDMEREYAHNEALRASGAQQAYNPVRSIAPGKHSLRQVVSMAQSNRGALEDSFARARSSKRDAAGRYGWK